MRDEAIAASHFDVEGELGREQPLLATRFIGVGGRQARLRM